MRFGGVLWIVWLYIGYSLSASHDWVMSLTLARLVNWSCAEQLWGKSVGILVELLFYASALTMYYIINNSLTEINWQSWQISKYLRMKSSICHFIVFFFTCIGPKCKGSCLWCNIQEQSRNLVFTHNPWLHKIRKV